MLYLLTGESGSGKTLWLAELVYYGMQQGVGIDGLITPAVFEDGTKVGIDCILLPTEEEFHFAYLDHENGDCIPQNGQKMCWRFDQDAMERCNRHLSSITSENPSQTLFIIDELGWLEFAEAPQGFTEAMRILDQQCFQDAIAVVRPQLLEKAMERWAQQNPVIMQPGGDVRGFFLF